MVKHLEKKEDRDAAKIATSDDEFYQSTLLRFAIPLSNREGTRQAELNDFVGTIIGMTRDNVPFNQALYEDIIYVGPKSVNGIGIAEYQAATNFHYIALEYAKANLRQTLVRMKQSEVDMGPAPLPASATSGLLTSGTWGRQFLFRGTNRSPTRFAFKAFLCHDFEQLADAGRPDYRVGRDVDRAPGGDRHAYLASCKGCHAGGDALRGAWAHYDWAKGVLYTPNEVRPKMKPNGSVFLGGNVVLDDSWENLWADGPNARLGWRGNFRKGKGVKQLGMALGNTRAFSSCMTTRVFELVCLRSPGSSDEREISALASGFEQANYNLRELFETVATSKRCIDP